MRAKYAWILAAIAAPLGVAACELVAGVHDVTLARGTGGTGGMGEVVAPDSGADAGAAVDADAAVDAPADAGADAAPPVAVPPGYGHYCSVTLPDGSWHFEKVYGLGDPCGDILAAYPTGTIQRAGLWSLNGINNVLISCSNRWNLWSGPGAAPIDDALAMVMFPKNPSCIFTVAPAALPLFGLPYGVTPGYGYTDPSEDVDMQSFDVFDFDVYHQPMYLTQYGPMQNPPGTNACQVDRLGHEQCHFGSPGCAAQNSPQPGCPDRAPTTAYRWLFSSDQKPILAVTDGIVRASWDRPIGNNCSSKRSVIAVEHSVGSGTYAERFVTVYGALSLRQVEQDQVVSRGQQIGLAGNSGCAGTGPQVLFTVLRLTNLSGGRSYEFAHQDNTYGFNGVQGAIDPFGWGGQGADPWAYWFWYINYPDPLNDPTINGPGAFSIYLWLSPQQAPPTFQ